MEHAVNLVPVSRHQQAAPGKVIRAALGWRDNLDWGPQDELQLTLGQPGVHTRLDRASLQAMGMRGVSEIWKVGPPRKQKREKKRESRATAVLPSVGFD